MPLDGPPSSVPIQGTRLEFVVNTDPAYNVTFVRVDSFDDGSGEVTHSRRHGS